MFELRTRGNQRLVEESAITTSVSLTSAWRLGVLKLQPVQREMPLRSQSISWLRFQLDAEVEGLIETAMLHLSTCNGDQILLG